MPKHLIVIHNSMIRLKKSNIQNKQSLFDFILKRSGWYTYSEFGEIIRKEQNRSDRSGLPFAYVQIDIVEQMKMVANGNKTVSIFLESLVDIIDESTRNYDVKFLTDSMVIGILLIDTSTDGAKLFIEKLTNELFIHFNELNIEKYIELLGQITISTYPINKIFISSDAGSDHSTPLILQNLSLEKRSVIENKTFNVTPVIKLKWKSLNHFNGGALAIHNNIIFSELYEVAQKPKVYKFIKRTMDIFGAILAIILTLPIILAITISIKITSRGPILFRQKRVGEFCKPFEMYKFRSMKVDADHRIHKEYQEKLIRGEVERGIGQPIFKVPNDPRITRIGKYIRPTNLDEIPQFFNILMGNMSFVGPRPPIDYEVKNYHPWHLRRVLEAKPGLTGLWQVNRTADTTFSEMVRYDIYYINNQSISLDLKIIAKTILNFYKIGVKD